MKRKAEMNSEYNSNKKISSYNSSPIENDGEQPSLTQKLLENGRLKQDKNGKYYFMTEIGGDSTPIPFLKDDKIGTLNGNNGRINVPYYLGDTVPEMEKLQEIQSSVYGDYMRCLPNLNSMDHVQQEVISRDPLRQSESSSNNHSFVTGYIGAPGAGKSFPLKKHNSRVHPDGGLYVLCDKDTDLGELFIETVYDTSAIQQQHAALDVKIAAGKNNPRNGLKKKNIAILKDALEDAFVDDNKEGKNNAYQFHIEWDAIKAKGTTHAEQEQHKAYVEEAVRQVLESEKIAPPQKGSILKHSERDGMVIRALDPDSPDYGKPILVDEMMVAGEGQEKLREFVAFLNDPAVDKIELTGAKNRKSTVTKDDLPLTFKMNFTGNQAIDGMNAGEMDAPLKSRLGQEIGCMTVSDPTRDDFKDRIVHAMTGIPAFHIAKMIPDDADDLTTSKVMKKFREIGLTEKQKDEIPFEHYANIANIKNTMKVASQLGDFLANIKEIANPDSSLYQNNGPNLSSEYADYLRDVDIDLRIAPKIFQQAGQIQPETSVRNPSVASLLSDSPLLIAAVSSPSKSSQLEKRGGNLEKFIQKWTRDVFYPKDAKTRGIHLEQSGASDVMGMISIAMLDQGVPDVYQDNSNNYQQDKQALSLLRFKAENNPALNRSDSSGKGDSEPWISKLNQNKDSKKIDPKEKAVFNFDKSIYKGQQREIRERLGDLYSVSTTDLNRMIKSGIIPERTLNKTFSASEIESIDRAASELNGGEESLKREAEVQKSGLSSLIPNAGELATTRRDALPLSEGATSHAARASNRKNLPDNDNTPQPACLGW